MLDKCVSVPIRKFNLFGLLVVNAGRDTHYYIRDARCPREFGLSRDSSVPPSYVADDDDRKLPHSSIVPDRASFFFSSSAALLILVSTAFLYIIANTWTSFKVLAKLRNRFVLGSLGFATFRFLIEKALFGFVKNQNSRFLYQDSWILTSAMLINIEFNWKFK